MKKGTCFLCCLFLFSVHAEMWGAIGFDAASSSSGNLVSSITWSHTTSSSSDRILIVGVTTGGTVSSVTYNGTNLTKLASVTNSVKVELWYLVNPSSGANNVVVTLSSAHYVGAGAHTYIGVNQTTPFGTAATNTGTYDGSSGATQPSVAVNSSSNDLVVDAAGAATTTFSGVGGGQTQRYSVVPSFYRGRGSSEAGAASVTMSWTLSAADNWAIVGVSLKALTLPIELYSFAGECGYGQTVLSWTTASEVNNDFFTVEKSDDGKNFQPVSILKGAGNSNTFRDYSIAVESGNAISYYRLRQTDYDGKSQAFSPITIRNCNETERCPGVLLNPDDPGSVHLLLPESGGREILLEVHNAAGGLIFAENLPPGQDDMVARIRLPGQPTSGLYIATARSAATACSTKFVLK